VSEDLILISFKFEHIVNQVETVNEHTDIVCNDCLRLYETSLTYIHCVCLSTRFSWHGHILLRCI